MRYLVVGTVAWLTAATALAQTPPPPEWPRPSAPVFVVLTDLRGVDPAAEVTRTDGVGAVGFPLSMIDGEPVPCNQIAPTGVVPLTQLRGYLECALGHRFTGADFKTDADAPSIEESSRAATRIAASLTELRKRELRRAISTQGSEIVAFALQAAQLTTVVQKSVTPCADPSTGIEPRVSEATYEFVLGRKPKFAVGEAERKTQIATDFNVLLTLASRLAAQTPPAAPPLPETAAVCQRWGTATESYTSTSHAVVWGSAHAMPLALQRATVTVDATLPAVAPQVIGSLDMQSDAAVLKRLEAYARAQAERTAEAEDLKLLTACPVTEATRLDALQSVVCALQQPESSGDPLVAVEALSKMTTPRRVTFLRWAVEHRTGAVRERALVALAQAATSAAAPAAATPAEVKQSVKFASGPMEHWSISADVFATRETTFKRDDSGTAMLGNKPAVFYVSLNFLLGDLPSTRRTPLQNLELKWLLQGSDSPLDSVGFGIGLRGTYLKRFGIDFDLLSPFVGWTWTAREEDAPRTRETRFGVSVNLAKALDWVK